MWCACLWLQSMLAMWRLILGHGKPRMFAALAAQRAALAAAPRSPSKPGLPPPRGPGAAAEPAAKGATAAVRMAKPDTASDQAQQSAMSERLWLQTAAATALGLHSPAAGSVTPAARTSSRAPPVTETVSAGKAAQLSRHPQPPSLPASGDGTNSATADKTTGSPRQLQPPGLTASGDGIEMEHLIVGVLLGTPLLFLLPTTLVFHAFALLLAAGAAALQA